MNCNCQCRCGKQETQPTQKSRPLTEEILKAWYAGKPIERWCPLKNQWIDTESLLYRIKPASRKPHVHAAVIKAYAEGYKIECRHPLVTKWVSAEEPKFYNDIEYRVAPGQN